MPFLPKKNQEGVSLDKPPIADCYRIFALLQEVSKGPLEPLCGELSLVHTGHEISEFSVTSFRPVGLKVGVISVANVAPFLDQ